MLKHFGSLWERTLQQSSDSENKLNIKETNNNKKISPTVFGRFSNVMIKELAELHDHVGVTVIWDIFRGVHLVVHLRNGPRVWYPEGMTPSARLLNIILTQTFVLMC